MVGGAEFSQGGRPEVCCVGAGCGTDVGCLLCVVQVYYTMANLSVGSTITLQLGPILKVKRWLEI